MLLSPFRLGFTILIVRDLDGELGGMADIPIAEGGSRYLDTSMLLILARF